MGKIDYPISLVLLLGMAMISCNKDGAYAPSDKEIGQAYYQTVTLQDKSRKETNEVATIRFVKKDNTHAYGEFRGELYIQTSPKTARLMGVYSERFELVTVGERNIMIKVIDWGDLNTFFFINGIEHKLGKNAKYVVHNGCLVLIDDNSSYGIIIGPDGATTGKIPKKEVKK